MCPVSNQLANTYFFAKYTQVTYLTPIYVQKIVMCGAKGLGAFLTVRIDKYVSRESAFLTVVYIAVMSPVGLFVLLLSYHST